MAPAIAVTRGRGLSAIGDHQGDKFYLHVYQIYSQQTKKRIINDRTCMLTCFNSINQFFLLYFMHIHQKKIGHLCFLAFIGEREVASETSFASADYTFWHCSVVYPYRLKTSGERRAKGQLQLGCQINI